MIARQRSVATRVQVGTAVGGRVSQWSRHRRELLGGLLLLAPALLILLGLVIYPFFYAIWLSFL